MSKISGNEKGELISAVKYLYENKPNDFSDCIKFATNRFYEKYNFQIKNLLKSYPKDGNFICELFGQKERYVQTSKFRYCNKLYLITFII